MPTFSNSESGSSVRTKINNAITTVDNLASTTATEGADLIGSPALGSGFFAETTVGGQLNEAGTALDGLGSASTLDQADVVLQGEQEVIIFDAGGDPNATRPSQSPTKTVIWFNHGSSIPANLGTYDIAVGGGAGVASVNTQTGTSYTLVLGDAGAVIDMDNAGANTLTIPTNATAAFSVGACIAVTMLGAGTTTIEGASGVTVNGTSGGSVVINNQYSGAALRKVAADEWVVQGDIT